MISGAVDMVLQEKYMMMYASVGGSENVVNDGLMSIDESRTSTQQYNIRH